LGGNGWHTTVTAAKILESRGWTFTAVIVDGRRGFLNVFQDYSRPDLPVHAVIVSVRKTTPQMAKMGL
jgi:hypothetical protein